MLKLYKNDLNYLNMFFRGETLDYYIFNVMLKGIILVYIFYHYYPGLSYVENHMSINFDKATLISP